MNESNLQTVPTSPLSPPDQVKSTSDRDEMGVYEGVGVAPGIAIGPVYLYARKDHTIEQREIESDQVEQEVERFENAIAKAERDLRKISSITREKLGPESASIFEAQMLMLRDEALYPEVLERIRKHKYNAGFAVHEVMEKHRRLLQASNSEYLRERSNDLLDVQDRLITHLRRGKMLSSVDKNTIIVSENLTAADIILFSRRGILGCVLDYGGSTSHVAIMARALGVPAVMSMHGITQQVKHGDMMILDGLDGHVLVNPDAQTLENYKIRQERYRRLLQDQKHLVPLPAETLDHHTVKLHANLEFMEELDLLDEYGADGIGLFRTEILFLMRGHLTITEDEQFDLYKQIVQQVGPRVTTFRILDLGGDKMLPIAHREHNPFLGWRGIRVLLDRPEVMLPQLRALLRASAFGPLRLLLPMITNLQEIHRFKEILAGVQQSLEERGEAFAEDVPVGIMVEVPAVALTAEQYAAEVDFFSIGTNDLTQYTLAVDRGNDLVSNLYSEFHPGVLKLIHHTIDAAHRHGIPVSLCGEMGGNPRATPLLVGMGIDELSASPAYLPEVKRIIREIRLDDAKQVAAEALKSSSVEAVSALIDDWLECHACSYIHFLEKDS